VSCEVHRNDRECRGTRKMIPSLSLASLNGPSIRKPVRIREMEIKATYTTYAYTHRAQAGLSVA